MSTLDLANGVQNGLDLMAVPDYIAGFMFGMTGQNHLEEIEACYNGGTGLAHDAHIGLGLMLKGQFSKGAMEFWLAYHELDNALKSCENMDDDFAAIEAWGSIFAHPKKLSETVGKNVALHHRTIKEAVAKEQADWAA